MTLFMAFSIAAISLALFMLVLWVWQLRGGLSAIVDVGWAFATGVAAIWLVVQLGEDAGLRNWLLAVMIGLWSLRLTVHLGLRLHRDRNDGRYIYFREALGGHVQLGMFVFFQMQALWALMFAAPVWAASMTLRGELGIWDFLAIAIWLTSFVGEVIADRQLHAFRADPSNKGRVCNVGLWRYSRHPNYFFEWLHWVSYLLIAIGSPYWWVALAGVLIMYVFVTRVTGIPFTEKQALRSRGEAYRTYQQTTSAFFPLPPRDQSQESFS